MNERLGAIPAPEKLQLNNINKNAESEDKVSQLVHACSQHSKTACCLVWHNEFLMKVIFRQYLR